MSGPIITLLTDFGMADGYVAAMKGVILDIVPHAVVVDAGHDVRAHDVQAAGWALLQYAFLFPEGTIHIAVVDPGVGTDRELVIARADRRIFLAPNNGLLHWVSRSSSGFDVARIRAEVGRPEERSNTFDGRDVLAYAGARLASGLADVKDMSEPLEAFVVPEWGDARSRGGALVGEIVHIDRFGNLITNIHRAHLERTGWREFAVRAGDEPVGRLYRTYGEVMRGETLALIGSHGHLEVAVCRGSAAGTLGLKRGDEVIVTGEA